MPVSLVVEHCGKVADDVDDTEDEAILGAHGEVATASVSVDGSLQSSLDEELVHLLDTSNLVGGSVDGEHEHEDDGEENRSVRAIKQLSEKYLQRKQMCTD